MALVSQRPHASGGPVPPAPSALAPFTTVNNGGARPLKAISAPEFATLQNGTTVYVESVRDYFKWVPASTVADNTGTAASLNQYCNPTVNGVNPGRFERLYICSPDWLLQDFTIDSAAGHNENPVILHDDIELYQRWSKRGTAYIETVRSVTYVQAPGNITVYDVTVANGASFSMFGTPDVVLAGVTITAVTTQNRATDTRWDITGLGLGAAHVGMIAVIQLSATPGNIGAYAGIVQNLGGGRVVVCQFRVAVPGGFPGSTPVTIAAGDVIRIINPTALQVGEIKVASTNQTFAAGPVPLTDAFRVDGFTLKGNVENFGYGHFSIFDIYTQWYRCVYDGITIRTTNNDFLSGNTMHGGIVTGYELDLIGDGFLAYSVGFLNTFVDTFQSCFLALINDCYFQNAAINMIDGSIASHGTAFFNTVLLAGQVGTVSVFIDCEYTANNPATTDWGTNNQGYAYVIYSGGLITYRGSKPSVNAGLGVGREVNVGGTDKLYAALPYVEGATTAGFVQMAP